MIEFDLDGNTTAANANFLSVMGYRLEEIQGRHHSMFVDREQQETRDYREFWSRLRQGEFVSSKFLRIGKGGRQVWIQGSYNPLMDDDGKPYKVVKFATDVTAIEEERDAQTKRRQMDAETQQAIVATVAEALGQLAEGDLRYRANEPFPPAYEKLRTDDPPPK